MKSKNEGIASLILRLNYESRGFLWRFAVSKSRFWIGWSFTDWRCRKSFKADKYKSAVLYHKICHSWLCSFPCAPPRPAACLIQRNHKSYLLTYCSQCPVEWRAAAKVYSGPASGWYPWSCGLLGSSSLLLPFVVRCPSVCLYYACLACYQVFSKARAQLLLLLFEPVLRYTIRCVSTRKHFRASQVSFNRARAMVSQCWGNLLILTAGFVWSDSQYKLLALRD